MSVTCTPERASPLDAGGVQAAALEQPPLVALQERVAQLEQAQAELEAFTAAAAHDLRTPLCAMDGFCRLLEESLAELGPHPARSDCERYTNRIRAGLTQMGELVEGMLRLSRASSAALKVEPLDLSAMARELLDAMRAREPGRACAVQVTPGLHAEGDLVLVQQLLENLLGNAWKFSAQQPLTHIEFGRDGAEFFVRDQGAGFDAAHAARLFQPFERLHSASQFAGTGVGLATVRRIAERHGGRVRAESCPGEGATFFFSLGPA